MKSFLAVAVILGCMAFLEARVLTNSAEQGTALGNPFFAGGDSNNGDGLGGSPVVGPVGGGVAAPNGGNAGGGNADDGVGINEDGGLGGGDTVVGGGYRGRFYNTDGRGVGGTRDRYDSPYGRSPYGNYPYGNAPVRPYADAGNPEVNNPDQRVIDDKEQAADPGQIVGSAGSAGATVGIVIGVVALVGVAAGVAIYVIKKRN